MGFRCRTPVSEKAMQIEKNNESPNPDYAQDAILVQRTLDGDYAAFEEIVREHQETVFRVAMRFVKDETEAQDVTQDAFLNAFRKIHTFKGNAALGSWLYRIAVNTSLMRLRKKRRRSEIALENVSPAHQASEGDLLEFRSVWHERGDEQAEKKELRGKIQEAVDGLAPKYQNVFIMKEFDGLSLEQIGSELTLSIPAVKSRLHRARLHLRASLEPYVMAA